MYDNRPDWDNYFMEIAQVVSKRSTCLRRSVGAVIVKNRQIVATGYNGTPSKLEHCSVTGCLREQLKVPSGQMHELCRGIHAEQNAVVQAAYHGVSVNGGTLYCTHQPCVVCTKILINAVFILIFIVQYRYLHIGSFQHLLSQFIRIRICINNPLNTSIDQYEGNDTAR